LSKSDGFEEQLDLPRALVMSSDAGSFIKKGAKFKEFIFL